MKLTEPTRYGVWTAITGGVTGPRAGWMKKEGGSVEAYDDRVVAEKRAVALRASNTLLGGYTPSGRPVAHRTYEVRPLPPDQGGAA